MVEINWTDQANYWMRQIHDYLEEERVGLGKSVINKIIDKTDTLKLWPTSGSLYPDFEQEGVRVIYYLHYRIAYLIVNSDRVDIIGVYHGRLMIEHHQRDHLG